MLFMLAFSVMPAVAVIASVIAVASRRCRRSALSALAVAVLYLVGYWSVSFPE